MVSNTNKIRPDDVKYSLDDRQEQGFVTLTLANQLCGVPVFAVREVITRSFGYLWLPRRSRGTSTCVAASSRPSTRAVASVSNRRLTPPIAWRWSRKTTGRCMPC